MKLQFAISIICVFSIFLLSKSKSYLPEIEILKDSQIQNKEFSKDKLEILNLTYNVKKPSDLKFNKSLQEIVDDIVFFIENQKLPKDSLSILLIDVKSSQYAGYQENKMRYPASVVKMFWMVAAYEQINHKILSNEVRLDNFIGQMIKESSNNAASIILDKITDTTSGEELADKKFEDWLKKREFVNQFYQLAEYKDININQKTYPISALNLSEPKGRDLQLRIDPENPIRNQISANHAGRLLYEISQGKAISSKYSDKMINLLKIDAVTRQEKRNLQDPNQFNPVRGFLSYSLPDEIFYAGKAGWTSKSRQEAAYISSEDGKTEYILVVIAESEDYSSNWGIFPEISSQVLQKMSSLNL